MGKKYKIIVDGIEHIVEVNDFDSVENINESHIKLTEQKKEEHKTSGVTNENTIKSPLQGIVQEIKVVVGQNVKVGELLMIIEAMKMENEIVASKSGKVVAIHQKNGAKVNANDPLIDIM